MLCKRTFLAIALLVLQTCANFVPGYAQQACNHLLPKAHQGCLHGQTCLQDNSCEKNYGPSVRGRRIARDARSDGQSADFLVNGMSANDDSVNDGDATQSSPLKLDGPLNPSIGSGIYPATTLATTSVTTPDVPYSNGPDPTCTDDSSTPATITSSDTISFWPLPTICHKSPALCETGQILWTINLDDTNSPRMINPTPQTAHRERPQGWLMPPYPQLVTPSQTGYSGPTGASPGYPITLSTTLARVEQKVPTAHLMGRPTQDPQAAHLEHPDLNLDVPGHGRVRRAFPSQDIAPEALSTKLEARAKIPKPQPQTARAMLTGVAGSGNQQLGGPDTGHPVGAGSAAGKLKNRDAVAALVDPRGEDEQTSTEDEDTDISTASIWESYANHVRSPADSFMVALMVIMLSTVVLVMIL